MTAEITSSSQPVAVVARGRCGGVERIGAGGQQGRPRPDRRATHRTCLERDLETRLFDRVGKKMVPTAGGARMMVVPAAFTLHTGRDHWHVLLRARAIENLAYVIAPAQLLQHGD